MSHQLDLKEQNSLPLKILLKRQENLWFRLSACLLGFFITTTMYLVWIY